MPELPEVEHYRHLLLPLVSKTHSIHLKRGNLDKKPPRKFLTDDEVHNMNSEQYFLTDVLRKGKLLCMVLLQNNNNNNNNNNTNTRYLFLHMGMTGRISTPYHIPTLKELSNNHNYPPPHTYVTFSTQNEEASFSDPRKFGSIQWGTMEECFGNLAPDALVDVQQQQQQQHRSTILQKLAGQSMGIKALLLDQRRAVSGVGNWVADEVLWQIEMHPDQTFLTTHQADRLLDCLHVILQTAVDCLLTKQEFPAQWLFHYRWNKKKKTKDSKERTVTFVSSGGRTSAIVPSIQKIKSQAPKMPDPSSTMSNKRKARIEHKENSKKDEKQPKTKRKRSKQAINEEGGRRRSARVSSRKPSTGQNPAHL